MSIGKIELSVGAMKIANKDEIFTEEEIDAINNKIPELDERVGIIEEINNKIPELDERVGVIEDEIKEINSSLDNIENEKATKLEVDVERKRIDNFTKLGEGSTTGDAELIDGRIGANGETYTNIGNNIRDIAKGNGILKGAISPLKANFFTLDTTKTIFDGEYVRGKMEKVTSGDAYYITLGSGRTAVVDIKPNTLYSVVKKSGGRFRLATDTIKGRVDEAFQGSIQQSVSGPYSYSFTTGENDVVLYVNISSTDEEPLLQIIEGQTIKGLTISDYPFIPNTNISVYSKTEVNNKVKDEITKYKEVDYLRSTMMFFPYNTSTFRIVFDQQTLTMTTKGGLYFRYNKKQRTIPSFSKTLSTYDIVCINIDILTDDKAEILESDIEVVKAYDGFKQDKHIPLFWYAGRKLATSLPFPVEYINDPTNMTIAWFGDSTSAFKKIPHRVGELINATVYDCSFAGGVMSYNGGWRDTLSFRKISEAIKTSDFSKQEEAIAQTEENSPNGFNQRPNFENLMSIDWSKITHIIVKLGYNDFIAGVEVGDGTDVASRTFSSAIRLAIENILTVYPKIKFYFITPHCTLNAKNPNSKGYVLKDYCNAIENVASGIYNFSTFNLYNNCGINELNKDIYLDDSVHYSSEGDVLVSNKIANFIKAN